MEQSTTNALCAVCHQRKAIYTCPRCAIHTCSLLCSKSHKSTQSCSGERDKTAYVPMNKYGWGTMVNDYTYLEDVGRKAAQWGREIVQGAFWTSAVYTSRGRGHVRGRGLGKESRSAPRGSSRGNRDVLRMHLDAENIDMEVLPPGMQRRRVNQSTWDARSRSPLMTVEFVFHKAKDPFAPRDSPEPLPFALLTHRNNMGAKISELIDRHFGKRRDNIPSWVKCLITSPEEEDTRLVYLMRQHSDMPLNPVFKAYHKLDSTQSLLNALRNRTFVEYPTIDVWEQGNFTGALVEADGTFVESEEEPRPMKQRRLDAVGGRKLFKSLLGGYTSNEEKEEAKEEEDSVLDLLDGYGSDIESLKSVDLQERHDSEGVDGINEPPASLEDIHDVLKYLGHDSFTEDQTQWVEEVEEMGIDWSESTDNEAELEQALQRQNTLHQHT